MKKILNTAAILSLVLASMSFAITTKDTTILGKDYAKITSCSDLGQLRTWTNDSTVVNAIVMQDISCGNADFKPIGQSESKAYEGIFDGNGKTISGMTLKQTGKGKDNYTGMFGVIGKKAQVKNVIIANSKIDGVSSEYAGILVGLNYGVVTNCQVLSSNTINASSATDVGGVAGRNGGYGTMDGCVNRANVTGGSEVGGIAGACTGAISNSLNYGNVSGTTAGGITGVIQYRTVESGVTHVPGRVALCQNKGSVTGYSYAGGIAGENNDGSVNNCRNDGAVSASNWSSVAGGVVGYSYFDGEERYEDGKYKTTVANSFNTATVSGATKGGVVGYVRNACKTLKNFSCKEYYNYASVSNSYYDSDKLKKVSAIGTNSNGVISAVSGKPTKDMFANDAFVALLNSGNLYIAWLFDGADYPILNCGSDAGAFKITFIVEGKVVLEGTTEAGKLVETVENPSVAGKTFKVWKDDAGKTFTTAEAQQRTYDRSLNYYAVFNELFKITFVTDFGVMLDTMLVEEGTQIFYSRIGDDGKPTETPADYETEEAVYKFNKWDRENLGVATKNDTIVGIYDVIPKAFDVKFFVQGEQYGETQKVKINEAAVAPADPVVEGFRFDGWDKEFTKITANLDVYAILEAVAYVCRDDGEVKCDTIPVPGEYVVPETGSNDSLTCVWKDQNGKEYKAGDVIPVEKFMTITLELVCTVNTFDVKFVAFGKDLVDEQTVAYGDSAKTPAAEKIPVYEGYRFSNWIEGFTRIISDSTINANYIPTVEVCFGAGEFEAKDCKTLDKDSTYDVPELPGDANDEDSFTCTAWTLNDEIFEGETFVAAADLEFIAKCHKNSFDVRFFVLNTVVDSQKVAYGDSAKTPADSLVAREGYRFDGWDMAFDNVVADLEVNAKMTEMVEVCFGDDCKDVPVDTTVVVPDLPEPETTTCSAWKMAESLVNPGDTIEVNANMSFEAVCVIKTFEVKFIVLNDTVKTDTVEYGKSATAPADPQNEGYRFRGWDIAFNNIVANTDVNAIMVELKNVCTEFAANEPACDEVPVDSMITIPDFPGSDSLTCTVWSDGKNTYLPGQKVKVSEIADTLVAQCSVNTFDVKFFVLEAMIDSQKVAYGSAATEPAAEKVAREGYRFDGWDTTFTRIISDLSVNAKMKALMEVCYAAADTAIKCDTIPVDTTITIPELPGNDSLTCTAWSDGKNTYLPGQEVLASEIADTLVAVCTVNEFAVKFIVLNDTVKTDSVAYGAAATAPADSLVTREGYRFDGWDTTFTRIVADLDVNANMTKLYNVCFGDSCEWVDPGDTIDVPELPETESTECSAWKVAEALFNPGQKIEISEDMNFEAICKTRTFDVKFFVLDSVVDSQKVAYGDSAKTPADSLVTREGYRFDGWDADFTAITSDLDVNANMTKLYNVCFGDSCEWVEPGDTIDVPELPETESTECSAWKVAEALFNPGQKIEISEDMNFEAVCKTRTFDVKFVAFDSVLVDSQKVAYGEAAAEPADSLVPEFQGYRFLDWDADFTAITSDLTVNAMFDTLVKVTISADVGDFKLDSTIYVLKDTTITGLKKIQTIVEIAAGQGNTCLALVDGKAIDSDSLKVSKDIDVTVNCDLDIKYVSFFAFDSLLGTIPVLYGFAADFNAPEFPNKRFVSWDADLSVITENMNVNAIYVDIDTVFVMVNGEAIDSIEIAKGDSVSYILPEVKSTDDSTFLGWKVDGKDYDIGDTVVLKYGSEIFADFEEATALHAGRITANFSIHSENGQLQVIGARIGDVMAVFDLQGRVVLQKRVQNSVELVNIANRGSYLVRVGAQTKRVVVR